jgi:hypothetical protein
MRFLLTIGLLLAVAACNDRNGGPSLGEMDGRWPPGVDVPDGRYGPDDAPSLHDTASPAPDAGADAADLPEILPGDLAPADLLPDGSDGTGDGLPTPDADAVETGDAAVPSAMLGEPCGGLIGCLDGACLETLLGYLCVPECGGGCAKGWSCFEATTGAWCLPVAPKGCLPCDAAACPPSWCRQVGTEGSFCLEPCATDGDCPATFHCLEDELSAARLCQPDVPSCTCTPDEMDGWLECTVTNSWGSCTGVAFCHPEAGLQECVAATPSPELCDGKDNDCDGKIDEIFPEKGYHCDGPDEDLCKVGKWVCSADGLSVTCAGDIPQKELCDDKDNDCDGLVDEDFPNKGKPCGASPLCGVGTFECSPMGLKTICAGVIPTKEKCDGKDNDCDGLVDEGFKDSDGDGVADCVD